MSPAADYAAMIEQATGRKLNMLERWQLKRFNRQMAKGKRATPIFPEREELTEGFQALPFFGAIFTFGISVLVMAFTAQDANAWRWAKIGLTALVIILAVVRLISAASSPY